MRNGYDEGTAEVDFVTFIVQSYFDTLLRYVSVISEILWSSCFESNGPSLSADEFIRCV